MSDTETRDPEGRITTEVRDHILLIGIDRPEKYNGFTPKMFAELGLAYKRLEDDADLWVALGNTLAGLYTGDASNRVGVYGNQLSGNVSANNMQAQGEASGARNLLGAGLGLANMGANFFGGMGGGASGNGSTAGSFGNLFGGGGTLWGNGAGYATNPWSPQGQFGGR